MIHIEHDDQLQLRFEERYEWQCIHKRVEVLLLKKEGWKLVCLNCGQYDPPVESRIGGIQN